MTGPCWLTRRFPLPGGSHIKRSSKGTEEGDLPCVAYAQCF